MPIFSTYDNFKTRFNTERDEEGAYPVMTLMGVYPHGFNMHFRDAAQFRQFLADALDYLDGEWPEEYAKLLEEYRYEGRATWKEHLSPDGSVANQRTTNAST